jgi:glycosyltransferase involved in cell wall biosynthesis
MHLGLNLIFLVPKEMSGLETYARELTRALLEERSDLQVTAFVNREASTDPSWREVVSTVSVPVYGRRRAAWVRGEQLLLPKLAQEAGIDVLHSLASTAPIRGRFARVTTIHDVIYRIHPEAHGWRTAALRMLIPLAARRSHRIIAPSQSTRRDLVSYLHVPESKIDVVPNGIGFPPAAEPTNETEVRRRYDLGSRAYVLTVSLKRPNKNLERLLQALALIPTERRPLLVLAGHATPYQERLRAHARQLGVEADTRFLDWIPGEDLETLYRSATAFVFPSLYEGFGLPVLEAMTRGVPVACGNRGALAEVADGAALLFDPFAPPSIAAALERLLSDPEERDRLREAGRANAGRFSWSETAAKTIECYERAVSYASSTR